MSHEELRAFLTSVLVKSNKSRSALELARKWTGERNNVTGAPAVQKAETK